MYALLQVRTREDRKDACPTLGAGHVFGYPYTMMCHAFRLIVTAYNSSEQAVSSEAEANMKNPSKSGAASTREAPPPSFCVAQNPFL